MQAWASRLPLDRGARSDPVNLNVVPGRSTRAEGWARSLNGLGMLAAVLH